MMGGSVILVRISLPPPLFPLLGLLRFQTLLLLPIPCGALNSFIILVRPGFPLYPSGYIVCRVNKLVLSGVWVFLVHRVCLVLLHCPPLFVGSLFSLCFVFPVLVVTVSSFTGSGVVPGLRRASLLNILLFCGCCSSSYFCLRACFVC